MAVPRPVVLVLSLAAVAACGPEEQPAAPTTAPAPSVSVAAAPACPAGRATCGHEPCDTDVTSSPVHCGTCGRACGAGEICRWSGCVAAPDRIAAGTGHVCWLHAATLACWGSGASGQLGLRDTQARSTPAIVPGIDDAVDVAAGGATTCVLRSSGHVSCWGAGGAGADCGSTECPEPVEIGGVRDAVRLAVGGAHACAVLSSGALTCWGQNESGQLGLEPIPTSPEGHPPTIVPGIADAFAVSAGSRSTCVLRRDGQVACFGIDGTSPEAKPRLPTLVEGVRDVVHLASGGARTCAVGRDGTVLCWGRAADPARPAEDKSAPAPLEGVLDVHRVAVSESGPCVLHKTGEVSCDNHVPRRIPGLANATAIAVGKGFACATRLTGRPVCWGTNADGVLGVGEQAFFTSPVAVEGIDDAAEVETTEFATCARRANGHVACWGGFSISPERWKPVEVPGITDATHLWGGFGRTCASRAGGLVTCFNAGHEVGADPKKFDLSARASVVAPRGTPGVALLGGQLFYFDETGRDKRTSPIQGVGDVVAVHASYADACAVQKGGAIVCWSAPADLALGKPARPALKRVKAPPAIELDGYSGWTAVLKSGELATFGLATDDDLLANPERGVSGAVEVSVSGTGKCALLGWGGVWCNALLYGAGASERWMQRGNVPGLGDAVGVSIASHQACAATRAGKVLCWGSNAGGLLGRHERGSSDAPLEILEPSSAAPASATPKSGF